MCYADGRAFTKFEWNHPQRIYFFIAPVVAGYMLVISAPDALHDGKLVGLRVMYGILTVL
jgi:hypothetical protein